MQPGLRMANIAHDRADDKGLLGWQLLRMAQMDPWYFGQACTSLAPPFHHLKLLQVINTQTITSNAKYI